MGLVESRFAAVYRAGLETFRQHCLYVEISGTGPVHEPRQVAQEDAFAVICGTAEAIRSNVEFSRQLSARIEAIQRNLTELNQEYDMNRSWEKWYEMYRQRELKQSQESDEILGCL